MNLHRVRGLPFNTVRLAVIALALARSGQAHAQTAAPIIWTVPEVGARPSDAHGLQVRHGRDLITATYAYIGPEVDDPAKRFAGNNLACTICHLMAGT